jgi:hypothetical protein
VGKFHAEEKGIINMKIAFLTNLLHSETGHINVGDVFIGMGLQFLLRKALEPEEVEFKLFSRFSRLTEENLSQIKKCDCIVYGGMPQYNNFDDWKFYYDDELWDDLNSTGLPIYRFAGGGGYPSTTMTPEEFAEHLNKSELTKEILKKSLLNVKAVTTRDAMAQAFLESNGVESKLLPCSGTFAALFKDEYAKTTKEINAICLTDSVNSLENKEDVLNEFRKTKKFLENRFKKPCVYLAQLKLRDVPLLQEWFPDDEIVYFDKYMELLDYYKKIDICVTSRLHCALPIHGIGGRSILIRVDTRGIAGKEIGVPVINLPEYKNATVLKIVENNEFSKIPVKESIEKSVNHYKNVFSNV